MKELIVKTIIMKAFPGKANKFEKYINFCSILGD